MGNTVPNHALTPQAVAPSDQRPRTWMRRVHDGGVITETCPSWCTATHANDQGICLDDLTHDATAVAMRFPMHLQGTDDTMAWPILSAAVRQWPHDDDADGRVPYVAFEPSGEDTIQIDPEGLAVVIAQIRAHADRLEGVLVQLVQARAEYASA